MMSKSAVGHRVSYYFVQNPKYAVSGEYSVTFYPGHTLVKHFAAVRHEFTTLREFQNGGYYATLADDLLDIVRCDPGVDFVEQDGCDDPPDDSTFPKPTMLASRVFVLRDRPIKSLQTIGKLLWQDRVVLQAPLHKVNGPPCSIIFRSRRAMISEGVDARSQLNLQDCFNFLSRNRPSPLDQSRISSPKYVRTRHIC